METREEAKEVEAKDKEVSSQEKGRSCHVSTSKKRKSSDEANPEGLEGGHVIQ